MDIGALPTIPRNLKNRSLLLELTRNLKDPKALLLLGSRRSGKTSLLYLLLNFLQKKGISRRQILFFDLENQLIADRLNQMKDFDRVPEFLGSLGADLKKRIFVFLDEVQYLENPSGLIKYLVDHYPNLKFIVTGSASIMVKSVFKDSMVGRVWKFYLRPLNFFEFLDFREERQLLEILEKAKDKGWEKESESLMFFRNGYLSLFEEFCLFGGYPEVVLAKSHEEKRLLLSRLYSDYIRKDIGQIERIREVGAYNNLVRLLAGQIGQLVADSELASSLRITRVTVNRFLFLLGETFIIKLLTPYFTNSRQEIVKTPKVYFEDPGVVNLLIDAFGDLSHHPKKGSLVENCLLCEFVKKGIDPFLHLHFWRTKQKQEVDFVIQEKGELIPYEVKYQAFAKIKTPSGLQAFIRRYKPNKGYVVTRDFLGESQFEKTRVFFVPTWMASI